MRYLILTSALLWGCLADDSATMPDADPTACRPGACVDGGAKSDALELAPDALDAAPEWTWDGIWALTYTATPPSCETFDRMRLQVDTMNAASFWRSDNPTTGDGTSAAVVIGWPVVRIDDMPPMLEWEIWRNADGTLSGTWASSDGCSFEVVAVRQ